MTTENSRGPLLRRALRINQFLVGYNVAEAVVSIGAGVVAGSIALVGFGFDSVIETVSAAIVLWRLRSELRGGPDVETCRPERRALRFVGVTFLLLAAYVTVESVLDLVNGEAPARSVVGLVVAALSLVLMPSLAVWKLRLARALGSRALRADGIETLVCGYLSLALLAGLGLNAWRGWWWADAVAALAMVPLMVKEGLEGIAHSRRHAVDCHSVVMPAPVIDERERP